MSKYIKLDKLHSGEGKAPCIKTKSSNMMKLGKKYIVEAQYGAIVSFY